ncbi:MAG: hypothetical protein RLZZ338_1429 [Cyanobacteriota bacterium]|jgi:hypothetical protein
MRLGFFLTIVIAIIKLTLISLNKIILVRDKPAIVNRPAPRGIEHFLLQGGVP